MGDHDREDSLDELRLAVGGIAHDFRSVLLVIQFGLDFVDEQLEASGAAQSVEEPIREIHRAIKLATAMVERLADLSRAEPSQRPAPCDLVEVITRTIELICHTAPAGMAVTFDFVAPLQVLASELDIVQLAMNFATNARDAMPRGGSFAISGRCVELDDQEAAGVGLPEHGRYVDCRFTDTGAGMSEAVLARIFEPSFTTKASGTGTGIGLPTAQRIARRYRGNVLVESTPGVGSTFRVLLPAA